MAASTDLLENAFTSQKHGFTWENELRSKVWDLPTSKNDTNTHDIPHHLNKFDGNENVSIKTMGKDSLDCGDIIRFYGYDFSKQNTLLVIRYNQIDTQKQITEILELDYNAEMHGLLFGTITLSELMDYVKMIKILPRGKVSADLCQQYKLRKNELQRLHNMWIHISPKVDSKTQRRVQCSIPKIDEFIAKYPQFVKYRSPSEMPSLVRGIQIVDTIASGRRVRLTAQQKMEQITAAAVASITL